MTQIPSSFNNLPRFTKNKLPAVGCARKICCSDADYSISYGIAVENTIKKKTTPYQLSLVVEGELELPSIETHLYMSATVGPLLDSYEGVADKYIWRTHRECEREDVYPYKFCCADSVREFEGQQIDFITDSENEEYLTLTIVETDGTEWLVLCSFIPYVVATCVSCAPECLEVTFEDYMPEDERFFDVPVGTAMPDCWIEVGRITRDVLRCGAGDYFEVDTVAVEWNPETTSGPFKVARQNLLGNAGEALWSFDPGIGLGSCWFYHTHEYFVTFPPSINSSEEVTPGYNVKRTLNIAFNVQWNTTIEALALFARYSVSALVDRVSHFIWSGTVLEYDPVYHCPPAGPFPEFTTNAIARHYEAVTGSGVAASEVPQGATGGPEQVHSFTTHESLTVGSTVRCRGFGLTPTYDYIAMRRVDDGSSPTVTIAVAPPGDCPPVSVSQPPIPPVPPPYPGPPCNCNSIDITLVADTEIVGDPGAIPELADHLEGCPPESLCEDSETVPKYVYYYVVATARINAPSSCDPLPKVDKFEVKAGTQEIKICYESIEQIPDEQHPDLKPYWKLTTLFAMCANYECDETEFADGEPPTVEVVTDGLECVKRISLPCVDPTPYAEIPCAPCHAEMVVETTSELECFGADNCAPSATSPGWCACTRGILISFDTGSDPACAIASIRYRLSDGGVPLNCIGGFNPPPDVWYTEVAATLPIQLYWAKGYFVEIEVEAIDAAGCTHPKETIRLSGSADSVWPECN